MSTVPEGLPVVDLTAALAAIEEWSDYCDRCGAGAEHTVELLEQATARARRDASALYTLSRHLRDLHGVLTGATDGN